MKAYMVLAMEEKINVEIFSHPREMPLIFAEGMIGALPVFSDELSAKESYPDSVVIKIEIPDIEQPDKG